MKYMTILNVYYPQCTINICNISTFDRALENSARLQVKQEPTEDNICRLLLHLDSISRDFPLLSQLNNLPRLARLYGSGLSSAGSALFIEIPTNVIGLARTLFNSFFVYPMNITHSKPPLFLYSLHLKKFDSKFPKSQKISTHPD